MKNKIEIKDKKVIKTFALHMDYVRESSIYEKIKGKGLAPEMTSNWEGCIEHEFIEGENFAKIMQDSMSNPAQFLEYSKLFCVWYKQFRDVVNMSMGDADFSDFILSDNKLYCIDFEHFKPGLVENDIANLATSMCFGEDNYSVFGMENAKIFVKTSFENLNMSSEKFYTIVKTSLEETCAKRKIASVNSVNEYFATFVCTTFVRVSYSKNIIADMFSVLSKSSHMWTLFADDTSEDAQKYMRYLLGSVKDDYNAIYLTDCGETKEFPLLIKTYDASRLLDSALASGMELLEVVTEKFNSSGLPIENMN